ncbi:MAG TPA: tetratricopeptide repeat protein [Chloroflexia bacterium]
MLGSRGTSFGEWLKQGRKERDLTQLDLADQIGCSVATIQKIEAGLRRPSRQVAQLLADFFRVPEDDRASFVQFARGTSLASDRDEPDFDAPLDTGEVEEVVGHSPAEPAPGKAASNLTAPITSIVGREEEIARLSERLGSERVRLLTLTGPPGIGKTRLAIEVGIGAWDGFEDGVFFVPLAGVRDPGLVAPAIAEALGMRDTGLQPTNESLRAYLHDKRMLLVLDNFEQVVQAAPGIVGLLQTAPGLKALVTSRAALNVLGEQQFPIAPLPLPELTSLPAPEVLLDYPSIRLFVERAQACNPAFELTHDNAPAVAAICARLDGLPLAIELVAARIKLLSPQALLPRLSNSLSFVKGGHKDLPARQQTLQDAIAWSYDLLDEGEKALFARLSVFSGGCTLNAIEAVCNAHNDLEPDTLEGVQSLSDKSLLVQGLGRDEEPRFSMLATIQEYAAEQLRQRGEVDELRDLHLEYYLAMTQAAEQQVQGNQQTIWFARLKSEHENLRAAIERTFERQQWERAAVLASRLEFFWRQGYPSEGRRWLEGLLPHAGDIPAWSLGRVYVALGQLATDQGDLKQSDEWLGSALEIGRSIGDREVEARALDNMAWSVMIRGDFERGNEYGRQALAIYEELGYKHRIAKTLYILGGVAAYENRLEEASALFSRVVELARELGQVESLAGGLNALGVAEHFLGKHEEALAHYYECLTLARQVGLPIHLAPVTGNLGKLFRKMGDYEQSRKYLTEGMVLNRSLGLKDNIAETLIDFAELATAEGQHERAARLYGAGERMLQELGMPFPSLAVSEMQEYMAETRRALGEERYGVLWSEGSTLSGEEAVDYALGKVDVVL